MIDRHIISIKTQQSSQTYTDIVDYFRVTGNFNIHSNLRYTNDNLFSNMFIVTLRRKEKPFIHEVQNFLLSELSTCILRYQLMKLFY